MNTPPREPTTARRRPSLSAFTVRRDSVGALSSGGKWNDDDNDDPDSPPLAKRYPSFSPQQTVSPKRSSPQKRHKKYGNDNDDDDKANHVPSLTYTTDESDVWRGHTALDHFQRRGQFWNAGKLKAFRRYSIIAWTGILQGCVAYATNLVSSALIEFKYETTQDLLTRQLQTVEGQSAEPSLWWGPAFWFFVTIQFTCAVVATAAVYLVPTSAGSGIPEVKCFLNGIDIPNVGALSTLIAKVLGVTASVSAGFPVGKEGPMVHSGAVIATVLATRTNLRGGGDSEQEASINNNNNNDPSTRSSYSFFSSSTNSTTTSRANSSSSSPLRNDTKVRDLVVCGAAAGVCTAFSAPIGGILFALEEGASYWGPSLTWRTFFCSMVAFTSLLMLNTLGTMFGKVGFDKLFSFGNFIYEQGGFSSFAVYELFGFVAIGALGGLVGAVFNHTNQVLTQWRLQYIHPVRHPLRRCLEVLFLSIVTSIVSFVLPLYVWRKCTVLPRTNLEALTESQVAVEEELIQELVQFNCPSGYYNELASLIFTDAGVAIRHLFHLHEHAFSDGTLLLFFGVYISLAVVVYGIAIPSGLFVPSLLSGAALGRYLGNLAFRIVLALGEQQGGSMSSRTTADVLAFSNTYALVGAAAVLGGMARMTISLTVILLECTGNEQYVLPLMLTLMTARLVGELFNHDLYHIHIHFKPGVHFLEAELKSSPRYHDLIARQIMSDKVVFFRPVEKVGNVVTTLMSYPHSFFPVVDPKDNGVLFGTIGRNELCVLLQQRAFGPQPSSAASTTSGGLSDNPQVHVIQYQGQTFTPLVQWTELEKTDHPRYPDIQQIVRHSLRHGDQDCLMDLRPYANTAPITIQQKASIGRTYQLFRTLGMRFLSVVNRYNQVVGTITRADLSPESLAKTVLVHGKKNR